MIEARGVETVINTTLCYIQREQQYLMLHRVKKENDLNHDKWIGIGGKFEDKESPEECLLREAREETGLTLTRVPLPGPGDLRLGPVAHRVHASVYGGRLRRGDDLL